MKGEKKLQWIQGIKLLLVVVCAFLYAAGGTEDMGGKWLRRFLAPGICGVGILAISRSWLTLIKVPLLIGASTLGYGAEAFWGKFFKRLMVGSAFAFATGSYHALSTLPTTWKFGLTVITDDMWKQWMIVALCFLIIPSVFIILGVWNPVSARAEETIIGIMVYAMAIMPVEKIKE